MCVVLLRSDFELEFWWNLLVVSLWLGALKMEVIFDCFFDETFARLERSGLHSRQKRRDVIDHLNAIILGSSKGMYVVVAPVCCFRRCRCCSLIYSFAWVLQWRCTIFSILLKVFVRIYILIQGKFVFVT